MTKKKDYINRVLREAGLLGLRESVKHVNSRLYKAGDRYVWVWDDPSYCRHQIGTIIKFKIADSTPESTNLVVPQGFSVRRSVTNSTYAIGPVPVTVLTRRYETYPWSR